MISDKDLQVIRDLVSTAPQCFTEEQREECKGCQEKYRILRVLDEELKERGYPRPN